VVSTAGVLGSNGLYIKQKMVEFQGGNIDMRSHSLPVRDVPHLVAMKMKMNRII
jgi:hypothetical protein